MQNKQLIVKNSINLSGKVSIASAKNALLPILAATLLTKDDVVLLNVPDISDIHIMCDILKSVGADIKKEDNALIINSKNIVPNKLNFEKMSMIRGSSLMLGSMVARCGYIKMPFPGGCKIGQRPIDLHLDGIRKLGVKVEAQGEYVTAIGNIKAGNYRLEFPSVGATENLMMASVFSKGFTKIENAAKEPEIFELGRFLNSLGAKIYGHGTDTVVIEGVHSLHGSIFTAMPDRIEAGTYMIAAAACRGDILLENVNPRHITALVFKLKNMGATVNAYYNTIRIRCKEDLMSSSIICMPYPAFPTDLQAPMCSLFSICKGTSIVEEKVFNSRFKHICELNKMGADIKVVGNVATINGVKNLHGANVNACDLRGGSAMIIAGMIAKGTTTISQTEYILRGYENIDKKMNSIGANMYFC